MISLLALIIPFVLDRITKLTALAYLQEPITLMPCVTLRLIKNPGISWSMLASTSDIHFAIIPIMTCTIIIALSIITYKNWYQSKPLWGNFLVISGALSNVVDRFWYGGVIDFIELSYRGYSFPVFNIADCAIIIGGVFMFYYHWND